MTLIYLTTKDHLHIRGENRRLPHLKRQPPGSPPHPHTWRKLFILLEVSKQARITSTYVEKTGNGYYIRVFSKDHLHIRVENGLPSIDDDDDLGSHPHTWRKHRYGK